MRIVASSWGLMHFRNTTYKEMQLARWRFGGRGIISCQFTLYYTASLYITLHYITLVVCVCVWAAPTPPHCGVWLCLVFASTLSYGVAGVCVCVCVFSPPSYHAGRVVRKAWDMLVGTKCKYIILCFILQYTTSD